MKHPFLSLLIVLLIFTSCSNGSKTQSDKTSIKTRQLDSLFNFSHSNGMFNGAVLVTKNDSIIYKKSFGYANEETKEKITAESVFYIASVSKQFTAMGIMILKEKGKLSFDDKIKDFFPNYPEYLKNVKIRQLLNHTSGITDTEYYKLINPSNEDVLEILMEQDSLELENGSTFRYSNSGYVLLALIIEKVSEKPIDQFFNQEIFEPLKMESTTATKAVAQKMSKIVKGYSLTGVETQYETSVVGPTGIYSSIDDLEKYNESLNSHKLITKETLNQAFTNGRLLESPISIQMSGQEYGYGFGWMPTNKGSKKYVQHDGSVDGFRSLIRKNLTDGYDYIFLTNHGARIAMDELTKSIDHILEESNYQIPQIPITNVILKQLMTKGVADLASNVKNKIGNNKNDYRIEENTILRLAYNFLRNKKVDIAIEIFKLSVELYPNSYNTFDSLAEGYFANKQFDLSKENYKKSLELNPDNDNGKMMLERIEKVTAEITNGNTVYN